MCTTKTFNGYSFKGQAATLPRYHRSYFIIVLSTGKINGALSNGIVYCLRIKAPILLHQPGNGSERENTFKEHPKQFRDNIMKLDK